MINPILTSNLEFLNKNITHYLVYYISFPTPVIDGKIYISLVNYVGFIKLGYINIIFYPSERVGACSQDDLGQTYTKVLVIK